jgi:hypothetical protein
MKNIFLKISVIIVLLAFGCRERTPQEIEDDNTACMQCADLPLSKRMKLYPFRAAAKIQMISWGERVDTTYGGSGSYQYSFAQKNDTVCYSKCKEIVTLNKNQIDQLSFLIYNIGMKDTTAGFKVEDCYKPRNAIIYINEKGKILEYFEVCFECQQVQFTKGGSLGLRCAQKLDLLKELFRKVGIKHGTKKVR